MAVKLNIGGVVVEMENDDLTKGIESGEIEIKTDDLVVYKSDQFESFKKNLSDDEYKKGKLAGEEMPFKFEVLKEKYGVEVTGKNLDSFAEALKKKTLEEAKIEPSKKIQELEEEKKKLQTNYATLETEFSGFKTTIQEKESRAKKDNTLSSFLPVTGLKVDHDITLLALKTKAGIDIAFDENNTMMITENGIVVKDQKTLMPIEPKSFIESKLQQLDLIQKATGGGGGGDEGGGGQASSFDKFTKEMETNGVSEGSLKFQEEMAKRIKEGTLKL